MTRNQRHYDSEYKAQAVKLAQEMGSCKKAADELGISPNTCCGQCRDLKPEASSKQPQIQKLFVKSNLGLDKCYYISVLIHRWSALHRKATSLTKNKLNRFHWPSRYVVSTQDFATDLLLPDIQKKYDDIEVFRKN